MGTPLIFAGSGGSGGLVSYGVRVLSAKGGLNGPGGMGPIGTLTYVYIDSAEALGVTLEFLHSDAKK
jgi:hypothetical protein